MRTSVGWNRLHGLRVTQVVATGTPIYPTDLTLPHSRRLKLWDIWTTREPTHVGRKVIYMASIDRTAMTETNREQNSTQESILENEKVKYGGLLVVGLILGILIGVSFSGSLAGFL